MFILVFILTILVLVVIHELGHYYAAKKSGIKVLEFGFGLPPRAWGKKIGETIWSINWLPFGGFVKLLGEDELEAEKLNDKRSFAKAPISKRILIVVAGVVMNLLLAWGLYYIVLGANDFKSQPILQMSNHKFVGTEQIAEKMVFVGQVASDSPALAAGLKDNDRVLSVNNQPIDSTEQLSSIIKQNAGKKTMMEVSDIQKTEVRSIEVTPRENPPQGQGPLGVSLGQVEFVTLHYATPIQKLFAGPIHSWNVLSYSFKTMGQLISVAFEQGDIAPVSQNVAGPVGITNLVKQILDIKNPLLPYLDFMAALSLNLAIVNILPFPGLDGGRFSFLLFEAITRKKPNATFEKYYHSVGLILLLGLIFAITISDIRKLLPF
jgi:regulator of sigma E protease